MITQWIKLLRVHQYVKNVFIFLPLFFALKIQQYDLLAQAGVAFVLFSLLASAVYIMNDLKDVRQDREHPVKKLRPIASGAISTRSAVGVFVLLLLTSLSSAYLWQPHLFFVLVAYVVMNAAYSFGLKHIAVLDLVLVSSGFVFRVFAGAVVTQVVPTHWIILMTFLLALFITLAKRRDDIRLANEGLTIRKNIGQYNLEFINASMIIMASVIIVGYILYTVSVDVQDRFHAPYLYLTVVFILVGIMRYLQITFVENASGDPTKIFLKDRFLQCTVAGWMGTFLLMVYH